MEKYDIAIIGSGPAGLTAAIYAMRAELKTIVIEKAYASGGQVLSTYEVDNYPGLPGISGMELGQKFRDHADKVNAQFITAEVNEIKLDGDEKIVITNAEDESFKNIRTKTVVIATGAQHRLLDIPGEEELSGMGVSYCATCDGAFFKGKEVAVVGGGDVAVEDAIFLARGCTKVYLIHRRGELRAAKALQNKLMSLENVEILWNTRVKSINGSDSVEGISVITSSADALKNNIKIQSDAGEEEFELKVQGVFVAVGIAPNYIEVAGIEKSADNYIVAGEDCATNLSGVFVAGDLRKKPIRQIVTAVADGANAIVSAEKYID